MNRRISKYVISKRRWNRPSAPWGTSPVGSPRRKADGPPAMGALGAILTPIENHTKRDAYTMNHYLAFFKLMISNYQLLMTHIINKFLFCVLQERRFEC